MNQAGHRQAHRGLKGWLEHPLTRGLHIDDPRTTHLRRRILQGKPFLRRIYEEWYGAIRAALPPGDGPVLELGSGAGFLGDSVPGLVRSEVFLTPGIDAVLDGLALPFRDGSLRGAVMTNVLHHLPSPGRFFAEAARCVRPGGVAAMVEPWVSPWSRWVYTRLHHEPFLPEAAEWETPGGGPLSGANGALPWILFERDRARFEREHPAWRIRSIEPLMPFRYLVSGGISLRTLAPGWTFPLWRAAERALAPWRHRLAMFALVVLERREEPGKAAERAWEDTLRRRMDLPAGARLEELGEPQRTWALYARSTVERGRGVIAALRPHGWRPGLRFLDAGCAYGGYLVAAAEAGAAQVVGIDVDDELLGLAEKLLESYGVQGRLEHGRVEDLGLLRRLSPAGFDVVTCTDVLEHVADPQAALESLAGCLAPGGRAYVAVPNFRCPAWVRSDPHYQILGITLLPPEQARPTAYAIHPWLPHYGVGDYHTLGWYRERLAGLGLETWLLNPPGETNAAVAARLREEAVELRAEVERGPDPRLPADLAAAVRDTVTAWADELLAGLSGAEPDPAVIDEYAVQTWELLAVKPG